MKFKIDPVYGDLDVDVRMVLSCFAEPKDSLILEVGANQEWLACILTDNGHKVLGVDLMGFCHSNPPLNYFRLVGDFCELARNGELPEVDCVVSTSAIEHFGLRTYPGCPGVADYDKIAMTHVWRLLRPGGTCYLTVPYGMRYFVHGTDWRVYDKVALQERLIGGFKVLEKTCFKSADCPGLSATRNEDGLEIVDEEAADKYDVSSTPHLTVYLKLQKPQ